MKILVCIKGISDSQLSKITKSEKEYPENNLTFRMNRYDEFALEEAVKLKEKSNKFTVDAILIGPEKAQEVLRRALAKGADKAIHIIEKIDTTSPGKKSKMLASFIDKNPYDIIMTGVTSEDTGSGIVGPLTAGYLRIPCTPAVISLIPINDSKNLRVKTELEGGKIQKIDITTPCLLTIQSGINFPRYPKLSDMLRSKKQEIHNYITESFDFDPSGRTLSISKILKTEKGMRLEGTPEQKAEQLIELLHRKSLL